ncbi:unnamed protein product [Meganyctiphanes norvegica]|uniref:Uncharacterized protein n=1 Tax=Meganyctiphanes norvegica TaxID=48144 RepID=A0AAV2QWR5_MEGNR
MLPDYTCIVQSCGVFFLILFGLGFMVAKSKNKILKNSFLDLAAIKCKPGRILKNHHMITQYRCTMATSLKMIFLIQLLILNKWNSVFTIITIIYQLLCNLFIRYIDTGQF